VHTRFIELAGEINRAMPEYVVQRTAEALNEVAKPVKGSKILLMGLAYKANVDDMRASPTFELMDLLSERGAMVDYYDPHISVIGPTREHANWQGKESIKWEQSIVSDYDLVLIATDHKAFNLDELLSWAPLIVDTRNAIGKSGLMTTPGQLWKA
jgi:UDP-N-acetyl-D-glucosamine dehydrogenase